MRRSHTVYHISLTQTGKDADIWDSRLLSELRRHLPCIQGHALPDRYFMELKRLGSLDARLLQYFKTQRVDSAEVTTLRPGVTRRRPVDGRGRKTGKQRVRA